MPPSEAPADSAVAVLSRNPSSPGGGRDGHGPDGGRRRRGRPPLMTPDEVLDQVRDIASRQGLFRVHFERPALYARARRLWGSWAGALLAAGIDYTRVISDARRRSADTRRQRPAGEGRRARR